MPYRDLEPVGKQLTIVIGLTVVGFMAFGLALSFYRNVLFEQTLHTIAEQNEVLRSEITAQHRDLDYYRSEQFKDKYAKENLNKVNPGESVLIIPQELSALAEMDFTVAQHPDALRSARFHELLRQMPTIEHWRLSLFHREKIEELKKSL